MKALLLVMLLLCGLNTIYAQQEVNSESLEINNEGPRPIHFYNGKKLEGCWKVRYLSDDWVLKYYSANFHEGICSDTVWHYDQKTDWLTRREIRLSEHEILCTEYYYDINMLFKEVRTVDGYAEGIYKEWYNNSKNSLFRSCEYVKGRLNGESMEWDNDGNLKSVDYYKDGMLDGWSTNWNYEENEMVKNFYIEGGSPRITEQYLFGGDRLQLKSRTVYDNQGKEVYWSLKPDCDSVRVDTLDSGIEIRDYRQGCLLSLERFNDQLIPHGIFEQYNTDGSICLRTMYENGEQTLQNNYDGGTDSSVKETRLPAAEGKQLLQACCDSKSFEGCDIMRPLKIHNAKGQLIFELENEEKRRYEYHGYDPVLKYHQAFSSIGDYNHVRWYIVRDDGSGRMMDLDSDDCLTLYDVEIAINAHSGMIATLRSIFEGDYVVTIYKYLTNEEYSSFVPVGTYKINNSSMSFWSINWTGDYTVLLSSEKDFMQLEFDKEELESNDDYFDEEI